MPSLRKTNRRARRNAYQARIRAIRLMNGWLITSELSRFIDRTFDEIGKALDLGYQQILAMLEQRRGAE